MGAAYPGPMTDITTTSATRGPYAGTARRKAEIVEAAGRTFAQTGYHGGSFRQIARELDLSFTSLKHHFPTKEQLLIAVLEDADAREGGTLAHDYEQLGVIAGVTGLARRNMRKPEALRLLAVLAAEASSPAHPAHEWFTERYWRLRQDFAASIQADIDASRLPADVDPADAARCIVAVWDGLQLQWLIDPDFDMATDLERALRRILTPGLPTGPALQEPSEFSHGH